MKEAGPYVPAEVLGFDSAPEAGDQFAVVENEARAREITGYRVRERRKRLAVAGARGSLEQMMNQLKEAGIAEIPLVVKGDVQGSVEAITTALAKVGTDEVRARIIHSGVGGITESDVSLAATSGAVVLCFNVRANVQARGVQVLRRRGELHVPELVDAEHLGVENTFVTFDQQVRQTDEVVDHQCRSESSQRDPGSQVRRGRREHVAPGERPRRHIQQKAWFVEFDRCRCTADRVGCP